MIKRCKILLFTALLALASSAHAHTLKIATLSPDGSDWMIKLREGAKQVEEQTGGRVKFKFYPGGVMGDNKAVLRKIKIGQLHGGAITAGALDKAYPDNEVLGLLFKYRDQGEIDYVRRHLDPVLTQGFEKGGYVILGMAEAGFAYIMSSKAPVASVADLRRQKVWIPAGDETSAKSIAAFGITPVPLPLGDVLAGLQTDLVNAVAAPPIGVIALQWHTQIKYLTDMPLLYSLGVLAISNKAFKKIKPQDQKIVREVMGKTFRAIDDKNKADNRNALATLKDLGIQFVQPSEEQKKEWLKYAHAAQQRIIKEGVISQKMVDRVDALLKQYRSK
ncbi:MAG: C4-dicarboxylate ABC transporter [Gammaproteobacteria bacterium]|nr:MAG: C4-dicarboxylate ABC transporter [Gammaproteobacteria bacterium]RTZ60539.1 MAG: C4-dicarboxylate ABC transporter [Gammaproteobacteria bacterium]